MMDSQKENPLEELYVDTDEFDRERIKKALDGIVGIDPDTGNPRFYEGFDDLTTKEKFVALLLYRRALDSLNDLNEDEDMGEGSSYFAELINVDSSTIRHKVGELDFVEKDNERGGYFIPAHNLRRAVKYLHEKEGE
jgi:hypothetical protein